MLQLFTLLFVLLLPACSTTGADKPEQHNQFDKIAAAKARLSLALSYLTRGQLEQSKANLDAALKYDPNSVEVHYTRAYYFELISTPREAEFEYQQALSLSPRDPRVLHNYGTFLCRNHKAKRGSKILLQAAQLESSSSSGRSYINLAYCALQFGHVEQALDFLQRGREHQPEARDILRLLVLLNRVLDQPKQAKYYLQAYLKGSQDELSDWLLARRIYRWAGTRVESQQIDKRIQKFIEEHPKQGAIARIHELENDYLTALKTIKVKMN